MKECPKCKYETDDYGELYCKWCGNKLEFQRRNFADLVKTDDGEKRILISIVDQDTILEMIRSDWGHAMKKAEEKPKTPMQETSESSWLTKTVESAGIKINRMSKEGEPTVITVTIRNDEGGFRDTLFFEFVDESAVPEVWDDLTDIMLLPCNDKLKRKYMREFTPEEKPYVHAVNFNSLYVDNKEKGNKDGQHDSTR